MSTPETVLLDMDGTIADTMGRACEIIREEHEVNIWPQHINDYWFKGMIVSPSVFIEILRRPGFYRELDVMDGAVSYIQRLRRNFDVRVCSAPMSGVEASCEREKRTWLEEHFDSQFAREAIITTDKSAVPGVVLLDDNPDIDRHAMWQAVIYDQPWNQHVTDLPRFRGWK